MVTSKAEKKPGCRIISSSASGSGYFVAVNACGEIEPRRCAGTVWRTRWNHGRGPLCIGERCRTVQPAAYAAFSISRV